MLRIDGQSPSPACRVFPYRNHQPMHSTHPSISSLHARCASANHCVFVGDFRWRSSLAMPNRRASWSFLLPSCSSPVVTGMASGSRTGWANQPTTLFWPWAAVERLANRASGSRLPAWMLSRTLRHPIKPNHHAVDDPPSRCRRHTPPRVLHIHTYHSTPTYLTPHPPTRLISLWILPAARPPPAPCTPPRAPFGVPRMT